MPTADFGLLKATLQHKLKTIVSGSDKRQDIIIQQSPDPLDEIQFASERDMVVSLLNRDTEMSRRVQGALQRMETGTYGSCLACEEPISVKRLKAVPWAELCLGCQEISDVNGDGLTGADGDQVELEAN